MLAHTLEQYSSVSSHVSLLANILVIPGSKEDTKANIIRALEEAAAAGLKGIDIEFDEVSPRFSPTSLYHMSTACADSHLPV